MTNEYNGYSLFNDVEDKEVRNKNRAQVIKNIFESGQEKTGVTSLSAAQEILEYCALIPNEDKQEVFNWATKYLRELKERSRMEVSIVR